MSKELEELRREVATLRKRVESMTVSQSEVLNAILAIAQALSAIAEEGNQDRRLILEEIRSQFAQLRREVGRLPAPGE